MRLAREGASGLTLVDVSPEGVAETRALVSRANPSCVALVRVADVGDADALAEAFAAHVTRFASMHACFNNAGIGERADWRQVVNVNLCAVVQGTRLAVDAMTSSKSASPERRPPVVNVASAGGLFPMPQAPVYSATKAAVVLFSRSLEHLRVTKGVRVNALCPQFTDTALVSGQFRGARAEARRRCWRKPGKTAARGTGGGGGDGARARTVGMRGRGPGAGGDERERGNRGVRPGA